MIDKQRFPILEFDPCTTAIIEPSTRTVKRDVPKACVITFFDDVMKSKQESGTLEQIATIRMTSASQPVYTAEVQGQRVGLTMGFYSAPCAARQLEELIAMGFERFLVCGGAGVLNKDVQMGHLVVPYAAVRDEGTSYHYIEPSREVECNRHAISVIEKKLSGDEIPYIKAKTWTTDAVYRETAAKIALRASEGCVTVELEAAALFAVAQFRGVVLGQILYGGDDVSGQKWDSRQWKSKMEARAGLVDLCLETALLL